MQNTKSRYIFKIHSAYLKCAVAPSTAGICYTPCRLGTTHLRANFPVNQNFQKAVGSLATRRRNIGSLVSSDWVTEQQPARPLIAHSFQPRLLHRTIRAITVWSVTPNLVAVQPQQCYHQYCHCITVEWKSVTPTINGTVNLWRVKMTSRPSPMATCCATKLSPREHRNKPTLALINLRDYFYGRPM